jgi:hypothetical protein
VYATKPTLQDLKYKIEIVGAAIPPATIQEVCCSLQCHCKQCICAAGGGHFEHL